MITYVNHRAIGADYSALFYNKLGILTYLGQIDSKLAQYMLDNFRNFDVTSQKIIRNGKVRIIESIEDILDIIA